MDTANERKHINWIESCCDEILIDAASFKMLSRIIIDELLKNGIVVNIPATPEYSVYAIDKNKAYISDSITKLKCNTCGTTISIADDNSEFWNGAPCIRSMCGGYFERSKETGLDYYGKLYSTGDMVRINAREHTGL